MIMLIKNIDKLVLVHSEGNPFAQALNECATLKNRNKCVALGLEMVEPNLKSNLVMCIGIVWIKHGTEKAGYDAINKFYEEKVGFKCKVITHAKTSDRAAKGIVTMFNPNDDACDVHDCDKLGKSSIRHLVRMRNKVQCFLTFSTFKFCINSNPQIIFFLVRCK